MTIIPLPFAKSIQASIAKFLEPENLLAGNQKFCSICERNTDTLRETDICDCPHVLFLTIMRYQFGGSQATRIDKTITCEERISVLVKSDDVISVVLHYKLAVQICHQCGFKQGHYSANISGNGKWFRCNDESLALLPKTQTQQQTCLRFSVHKNLM